MYLIIQKIYEKNNKILKEGLKDVLNGADVSTLTGAIKDFTNILGKELFSEIVTQIENLVFEDSKRKNEYEAVRFAEKSLITKNGKAKFERIYYKDNETGENVCLTDKVLGLEKGERIDKKVKAELIQKASEQSYSKSGKLVVPEMEISSTTVMRNVRQNEWRMIIEVRREEEKIKDTQEMWEDVAYYIDCTYKKEEIETAFVMGDGASYIKAGTEWIAKSVFVLDTFHLEKYINHLNYDEY